jgi:hypothetical protein
VTSKGSNALRQPVRAEHWPKHEKLASRAPLHAFVRPRLPFSRILCTRFFSAFPSTVFILSLYSRVGLTTKLTGRWLSKSTTSASHLRFAYRAPVQRLVRLGLEPYSPPMMLNRFKGGHDCAIRNIDGLSLIRQEYHSGPSAISHPLTSLVNSYMKIICQSIVTFLKGFIMH